MFTKKAKWIEILRRALVDAQSNRSVCRELDIDWDTLRKMQGVPNLLETSDLGPGRRSRR